MRDYSKSGTGGRVVNMGAWSGNRFGGPACGHEPDYGFQSGVNLLKLTVELGDGAEPYLDLMYVIFDRGKPGQRVLIRPMSWFARRTRDHGVHAPHTA
ncbi:MAG: hypothetical protein LC799_05390 [Actinobacteria bacterium]|nr:hypothetical protein [Actinomycetota bacterium]